MFAFLALRSLGNSLKCSSPLQNCVNPLKYETKLTPAAQHYATGSNINPPNPGGLSNDGWRTIYHLPLIPLASAFNRIKVPYSMMNAIAIPAAFAFEQSAQLPPSTAVLIAAVGLTSCCTLAICSLFVRNLIGFIYVNDNNDKLKLAYVDYWGRRKDVCVNMDDVIPESERSNPLKLEFYQPLCLYSDNKVKYKLLPRFGRIEDLETFNTIFGE